MQALQLRVETQLWRFYFDRATPAQQKLIASLMKINWRPVQAVAFWLLMAFTTYQAALLINLLHLAH